MQARDLGADPLAPMVPPKSLAGGPIDIATICILLGVIEAVASIESFKIPRPIVYRTTSNEFLVVQAKSRTVNDVNKGKQSEIKWQCRRLTEHHG